MRKVPDKIHLGRKFLRSRGLLLDAKRHIASTQVDGRRMEGHPSCRKRAPEEPTNEEVYALIEYSYVEKAILQMGLSEFSKKEAKLEDLRDLIWERRAICIVLGRTRGIQNKINLLPCVKPICEPIRRLSPKEEE